MKEMLQAWPMPATTTRSAPSSSPASGEKVSEPAATRRSAATTVATRTMKAPITSTCSTSSVTSVPAPKPVVAMVAGYAVGGGHVLHMMCDLTIAADNAQFGQTGPKVGSFDGGWGASYMARIVGQKKAREIWFLCRLYDAKQALDMGLVNTVVPLAELERETVRWCREMLQHSPWPALPEGGPQRRLRRPGRFAGAGRQCHHAVLHDRRGSGRAQRIQRETPSRLLQIQAESLMTLALYRYQLPLPSPLAFSRSVAGGARGPAGTYRRWLGR